MLLFSIIFTAQRHEIILCIFENKCYMYNVYSVKQIMSLGYYFLATAC